MYSKESLTMDKMNETPQGDKNTRLYKNGNIRNRIKQLLLIGKYNVQQLSALTGACDPRGHIRVLRDNGVPVSDYWASTGDRRYKVYFIHKEE